MNTPSLNRVAIRCVVDSACQHSMDGRQMSWCTRRERSWECANSRRGLRAGSQEAQRRSTGDGVHRSIAFAGVLVLLPLSGIAHSKELPPVTEVHDARSASLSFVSVERRFVFANADVTYNPGETVGMLLLDAPRSVRSPLHHLIGSVQREGWDHEISAGGEPTNAHSICASCEAQVGLGATYHFWGPTGGLVFAATMTWDESRYELGVFRVARAQVLRDRAYREGHLMADPYWAVSLSRRWQLFQRGPVKGFLGFGVALKTESDQLSATRWDFASQLGLRFRIPGQLAVAELTVRHWSNAGIRLPNHGQDFLTLTFWLNTGRFGVNRADQISLDQSFESARALAAKTFEAKGSLP